MGGRGGRVGRGGFGGLGLGGTPPGVRPQPLGKYSFSHGTIWPGTFSVTSFADLEKKIG